MTCAFRENWGKHKDNSFRDVEEQNFGTCYTIDLPSSKFFKRLNFEFSTKKGGMEMIQNIDKPKPKLFRGEIMGTELLTLEDKFVINSPLVSLSKKSELKERSSGSIVEIPYGNNGSDLLIAKGLFTLYCQLFVCISPTLGIKNLFGNWLKYF